MTDLPTLQARLTEAETARHRLLTGAMEVTVSLQGLGTTTYTQATARALDKYIGELRAEMAKLTGGPRRGPLLMKF